MKQIKYAIQDVYPDEFSWCYGCGRLNDSGLHFRTGWRGDETVTYYKPDETHTAVPGFVYGGLLASLIDCHGTASASLAKHRKNGHEPEDSIAPPRFVTAGLQVDFLKPVPEGAALQAIGKPLEVHPKKWETQIEVYAEGVRCVKGKVTAVVMPEHFVVD